VRSNLEVPLSAARVSKVRPGSDGGGAGIDRLNMTWKSGVWLRLRSGCSSCTSFSNGRSWWV
jgi:Fe-S cluster biogenesis protein NfuA